MTTSLLGRDLARRRTVAFHEAAHIAVSEALGWTLQYAWITDEQGEMGDVPPAGIDPDEKKIESAVISMAGPAANERLLGYTPYGCEHDEQAAIDALAGMPVDFDEIAAAADELVVENWDRIIELSDHLYEHGEL